MGSELGRARICAVLFNAGLWAAILSTDAHGAAAEVPKKFLHCEGSAYGETVTHDVVLYSHTARFDGQNYGLVVTDDSYLLNGPIVIVADMIAPKTQVVIDRITGEYAITVFGKEEADYSRPHDKGCIAVRRRL
ncbi:MAG TPA: hypothetical protein VGT78_03100 [Rhizomicrobium sp.]|nr:hypothetical protein [Rhizomicrobium sp.]